jgi:two-component system, sensor histidine kinase RegB
MTDLSSLQIETGNGPALENLRRLVLLRYILCAVLLGAIGIGEFLLMMDTPLTPLFACVSTMLAFNAVCHRRLHLRWPITHAELLVNLMLDIALLGVILYLSGGSANPLISLLLLPTIVAAAVLPQRWTWAVAGLSVSVYTLLVFFNDPLIHHSHHNDGSPVDTFDLHLFGMWLTFMLSAVLVALFLSRMAQALKEQEKALALAREEALRNERIVALGTLAAGAAHELGTPLGNMLLLADALERRFPDDGEAGEDIAELKTQILTCKGILGEMVAAAGGRRSEGGHLQPADQFLSDALRKWTLIRPATLLNYTWHGSQPAPRMLTEQTLSQALINLLNNAADASPEAIEVDGRCQDGALLVDIRDRGTGLTPEVLSQAGEAFYTTKAPGGGLGIGLFLANATIERARGKVRLTNRPGGGAVTSVVLPLPDLSPSSQ